MHASTGKPDPLPNIDETGSLRQHFKCRGTEWLTASVGIGVFTRRSLCHSAESLPLGDHKPIMSQA